MHIAFIVLEKGAPYCLYFNVLASTTVRSTNKTNEPVVAKD